MKIIKYLTTVTLTILLSSCASIVDGRFDKVSVNTTPLSNNTTCNLKNDIGSWAANSPGQATITKSRKDLEVICQTPEGATGRKVVKSSVSPWFFGNIIFGGIIGAVVDPLTGAMWRYPQLVTVDLTVPPSYGQQPNTAPYVSGTVPIPANNATAPYGLIPLDRR